MQHFGAGLRKNTKTLSQHMWPKFEKGLMSMERICQRAVAVTGVSQEIMPSYGRE
jgi:hypothetical protein